MFNQLNFKLCSCCLQMALNVKDTLWSFSHSWHYGAMFSVKQIPFVVLTYWSLNTRIRACMCALVHVCHMIHILNDSKGFTLVL